MHCPHCGGTVQISQPRQVYTHLFDFDSHEVTWGIDDILDNLDALLKHNPARVEALPVTPVQALYAMHDGFPEVNHVYAMETDLTKPIFVIPHPSNGRRHGSPGFPPVLIIDGQHRIVHAYVKQTGIMAIFLDEPEERCFRVADTIFLKTHCHENHPQIPPQP